MQGSTTRFNLLDEDVRFFGSTLLRELSPPTQIFVRQTRRDRSRRGFLETYGLAEVELHAKPDDPGADDFQHVVAVGPLETAVALQNGRFVGRVEHVRAHREAEVLQRELLLHAEVEDAGVVIPERVRTRRDRDVDPQGAVRDVTGRLRTRTADALEVDDRIALVTGQVGGHVEAPRTIRGHLIQAVHAVRPLAVDVDRALRARAGARTLNDLVAIAKSLATGATDARGRIFVLAVRRIPLPVGVREVATEHPTVGKTLVEGDRSALVILLAVAVLQQEAVTGRNARTQLPNLKGVRIAVRQHAAVHAGPRTRGDRNVVAADVLAAHRGEVSIVGGAIGTATRTIEHQTLLLQQVGVLAEREVQADHELRQQRMLEAQEQLVVDRGIEVRVNGIGLQQLAVVRVDVGAEVLQGQLRTARQSGVADAVSRAVEIGVALERQRVQPREVAGGQLVGVLRVAGTEQRLVLGAEGVGDAETGDDRLPLEARVLTGVVDRRQKVGEQRTGVDALGRVLAALLVVTQTEVRGQIADRDRVLEVRAGVLGLDTDDRVAGDGPERVIGRGVRIGTAVGVDLVAVTLGAGKRRLVRGAVADAVLQLVRDAAGVEERGRIQLLVLLRTLDLGEEEAVVPDAGRVEERRNVAALGDQLETAVDLRVETGQVEVRAEDVGVFELVRGRGRTELALIPRGLLRTQGTGVAAELHLVALPRESRGRVAGRDLSVDLGVPVLKGGEILEVVDRAQIDLRLGVGAPNPQTILDDR